MATADISLQQDIHDLYVNHHGWLHGWLRRRLGGSDHAADLAHDTYVRVLASGRVPLAELARPHLMQIAKGVVIDRHRRQLIEQAYLDALAAQPDAWAASAEERAIVLQTLLRVGAMLDQLAPKVREAFLLSQLDGLTYSEIARQLSVSVGSVRKYMLKALLACHAALSDAPEADPAAAVSAQGRIG